MSDAINNQDAIILNSQRREAEQRAREVEDLKKKWDKEHQFINKEQKRIISMVESMIDGTPDKLKSLLSGVVSQEKLEEIISQRSDMQKTLDSLSLARDNIDGLGESLAKLGTDSKTNWSLDGLLNQIKNINNVELREGILGLLNKPRDEAGEASLFRQFSKYLGDGKEADEIIDSFNRFRTMLQTQDIEAPLQQWIDMGEKMQEAKSQFQDSLRENLNDLDIEQTVSLLVNYEIDLADLEAQRKEKEDKIKDLQDFTAFDFKNWVKPPTPDADKWGANDLLNSVSKLGILSAEWVKRSENEERIQQLEQEAKELDGRISQTKIQYKELQKAHIEGLAGVSDAKTGTAKPSGETSGKEEGAKLDNTAKEAVNKLNAEIKSELDKTQDLAQERGKAIGDSLSEGLEEGVTGAGDKISTQARDIALQSIDAFKSAFDSAMKIWNAVAQAENEAFLEENKKKLEDIKVERQEYLDDLEAEEAQRAEERQERQAEEALQELEQSTGNLEAQYSASTSIKDKAGIAEALEQANKKKAEEQRRQAEARAEKDALAEKPKDYMSSN